MTTKKIVLCGSTGAGKSATLLEFKTKTNHLVITNKHTLPSAEFYGLATGSLADYRVELSLACERAFELMYDLGKLSGQDYNVALFESSLIDSCAYAAMRVALMINEGTTDDDDELLGWNLVMHMCARMLRDSFTADAIIFVPGNDGTYFSEQLELALEAVVNETLSNVPTFKLNSVEPLQRLEEIAKIIQSLDDGPQPTIEESPGEDN